MKTRDQIDCEALFMALKGAVIAQRDMWLQMNEVERLVGCDMDLETFIRQTAILGMPTKEYLLNEFFSEVRDQTEEEFSDDFFDEDESEVAGG